MPLFQRAQVLHDKHRRVQVSDNGFSQQISQFRFGDLAIRFRGDQFTTSRVTVDFRAHAFNLGDHAGFLKTLGTMKIAFLLSEHVTTKLLHATGQLHTEILLSQLRIELFNGAVMVGLDLTKFSSCCILLGGNRTTRVERPEYFNRCTRTGDVFFVINLQFIRKLLRQTVERIANHRT